MDNLKPLTILLRYTEGIAFDLLKLGKASKISSDLWRLSQVFGSVRAIFEGFVWSLEGFARSSAVFEIHRLAFGSLRFHFGYLHCNLHLCSTFLHCVTLFCTVLTKNALLFSQSECSNFFKCIIIPETQLWL